MKLLFDFFPILVFFICFKYFGIYSATAAAMAASFTQVLIYMIKYQCYEKMHLIGMIMLLILGSATLFFHDPWFIKWKPTGIYWLSAMALLGSACFAKKTLIQSMMEANVDLSARIWSRLNLAWALFFIIMGIVNIYVAYNYSTEAWVNFKLFGGVGFTIIFVFFQAMFLSKHIAQISTEKI